MSNLSIVDVIDKTRERFEIAPEGIKFDAEKGFALSLLNNNSYLRDAAGKNPASLAQAVASVAAIGLSLNPAEKQAYLITRNVKVGQNQWETRVFLEPSYVGLIRLATNAGQIKWVQARCVYADDTFADNGPGNKPDHKYNPFSKERGDFVGVYCVAKTDEGDYLTEIMAAEDVYGIRDRSEAWKRSKSGPWKTDFAEMAKKTVIRRAFKTWPRTNNNWRLAEAVNMSNENEGFEPIVTSPKTAGFTIDQKEYFDQLIENQDAVGMFLFRQTLGDDQVYTNLYHSFAKGEKGKYQKLVDALCRGGQDEIDSAHNRVIDCLDSGDDLAIAEILTELPAEAVDIIKNRCDAAQAMEINSILEQAAA